MSKHLPWVVEDPSAEQSKKVHLPATCDEVWVL